MVELKLAKSDKKISNSRLSRVSFWLASDWSVMRVCNSQSLPHLSPIVGPICSLLTLYCVAKTKNPAHCLPFIIGLNLVEFVILMF